MEWALYYTDDHWAGHRNVKCGKAGVEGSPRFKSTELLCGKKKEINGGASFALSLVAIS